MKEGMEDNDFAGSRLLFQFNSVFFLIIYKAFND